MNRSVKSIFKIVFYPLVMLRGSYWEYLKRNDTKKWASVCYRKSFKKKLDWDNPQGMNEKQRWIQFNTDISQWTRLADKYRAREYIKEKELESILNKLYAKWDKVEDIDLNMLPNQFVLKTNHGCGEVIIVKDKAKVNIEELKVVISKYLNRIYGYDAAETQYFNIPPCCIAEELLEQDGGLSSSLIDYKFYTFHGEIEACAVFYNRNDDGHASYTLYDKEWNIIEGNIEVPKPYTYNQMKECCRILCKQFPFVRMDFYEVNKRLYFGEFTFTPAGLSSSQVFSFEKMEKWGKLMDLTIYPNYKITKK